MDETSTYQSFFPFSTDAFPAVLYDLDYLNFSSPDEPPSSVGTVDSDPNDDDEQMRQSESEDQHTHTPVQFGTPAQTPNGPTTDMVSTAFYPGADVDPSPYDSIIISSDEVYFYVHRERLLSVSSNSFNSLNLPVKTEVYVPEHATLFNVVLHVMYGISCSKYSPSLDLLLSSLSVLEKYGVAVKSFITPETPLFDMILTHVPPQENAIEIYMSAAAHDIFSLAQAVSPHLLSFQLPTLTDDMATRMGPIYLKRLFSLHMIRSRTLLQLTAVPPKGHLPTVNCSFVEQKKLTRAWSFACANLVWDVTPDSSPDILQFGLRGLAADLTCERCKESLNERITEVVRAWKATSQTI